MIGFIGQGWIGKNMADDFERRGYETVRYSLEDTKYKDAIKDCDIVFIAVPTPTFDGYFDDSAVRLALELVGEHNIAVIKSTILPGTTRKLQKDFPHIVVTHSPEFLREKNVVEDTRHPKRNIIGITNQMHIAAATKVLKVLPLSPFNRAMSAESAECVKYIGNSFLYTKLVFFNMMYDMTQSVGAFWPEVIESVVEDERIGASHTTVIDQSGDGTVPGRGAGGHCFIKDFAALTEMDIWDAYQFSMLDSIELMNRRYLERSGKDLNILREVYGEG